MPRHARQLSASGYLHLIVRGIGRQALFEEKSDYNYYLSILKRYSKETGIVICAYCLMENHVHLLVKDKNGATPLFMKKIGVSYSRFYNNKYDRCGHLFQDRYLSESVESEAYLLTVFRYILNNPQKAGICAADVYPWSSYGLYDSKDTFVNTTIFHSLIGDYKHFTDFMAIKDNEECIEYKSAHTDEWARSVIKELLDVESGTVLQNWDRSKRNDALRKLKDAGLSIRQIERLTGIGRNIIQRV